MSDRQPVDMRDLAATPGAIGWAAVGAVALATVVIGVTSADVIEAWATPGARAAEDPEADAKRIERFQSDYDGYLAQISGRSAFFIPPAPPPPPPPPPPERDDDAPPPPPSRYGGPKVVAFINDTVWFDNGMKLSMGEEESGVEVIGISAPWSVRVVWKGVEFDVTLFERTTNRFLESQIEEDGKEQE